MRGKEERKREKREDFFWESENGVKIELVNCALQCGRKERREKHCVKIHFIFAHLALSL